VAGTALRCQRVQSRKTRGANHPPTVSFELCATAAEHAGILPWGKDDAIFLERDVEDTALFEIE
jgi:hypothetical protein